MPIFPEMIYVRRSKIGSVARGFGRESYCYDFDAAVVRQRSLAALIYDQWIYHRLPERSHFHPESIAPVVQSGFCGIV